MQSAVGVATEEMLELLIKKDKRYKALYTYIKDLDMQKKEEVLDGTFMPAVSGVHGRVALLLQGRLEDYSHLFGYALQDRQKDYIIEKLWTSLDLTDILRHTDEERMMIVGKCVRFRNAEDQLWLQQTLSEISRRPNQQSFIQQLSDIANDPQFSAFAKHVANVASVTKIHCTLWGADPESLKNIEAIISCFSKGKQNEMDEKTIPSLVSRFVNPEGYRELGETIEMLSNVFIQTSDVLAKSFIPALCDTLMWVLCQLCLVSCSSILTCISAGYKNLAQFQQTLEKYKQELVELQRQTDLTQPTELRIHFKMIYRKAWILRDRLCNLCEQIQEESRKIERAQSTAIGVTLLGGLATAAFAYIGFIATGPLGTLYWLGLGGSMGVTLGAGYLAYDASCLLEKMNTLKQEAERVKSQVVKLFDYLDYLVNHSRTANKTLRTFLTEAREALQTAPVQS
jgi:hypothetical protein